MSCKLLALFLGDAFVPQQHEIARPDDLLFGLLIQASGRVGEPGEQATVAPIRLRRGRDLLRLKRSSRQVAIDLLDEPDLPLVELAVGGGNARPSPLG